MHSNINISHTLPPWLVQIQGTIFTSSVHERDGGNGIQGKGSELVAGKVSVGWVTASSSKELLKVKWQWGPFLVRKR